MKTAKGKSAQDFQDGIIRKMSAERKLKLASDFSLFILNLHKLAPKTYGFPETASENRKNSQRI